MISNQVKLAGPAWGNLKDEPNRPPEQNLHRNFSLLRAKLLQHCELKSSGNSRCDCCFGLNLSNFSGEEPSPDTTVVSGGAKIV